MEIPAPDISAASNQLASSDLGAAFYLLLSAIFFAISAYIYFTNKQLNNAKDEKTQSEVTKETQRQEHESLLRELKDTLSRLADVQENTMEFIKETVDHERRNHENCKDKFYDKLVEIEHFLKGTINNKRE